MSRGDHPKNRAHGRSANMAFRLRVVTQNWRKHWMMSLHFFSYGLQLDIRPNLLINFLLARASNLFLGRQKGPKKSHRPVWEALDLFPGLRPATGPFFGLFGHWAVADKMSLDQSWALPVFFHFFNNKKWFFCTFYQVNDLFLHQSYLKSPLPVKLTW